MRPRRWLPIALVLAGLGPVAGPGAALGGDAEKLGPRAGPAKSLEAPRRLHSVGHITWIYAGPRKAARTELGYIRVGDSVKVRAADPQRGAGCADFFVPIEPYGWVCLDRSVTFDESNRYLRALQSVRPRAALLPFEYALSNGAPMYRRLPARAEWQKAERPLGPAGSFQSLSWGNRGHEKLAEVRAIAAADPVPDFLRAGGSAASERPLGLVRRQIPLGSMLAFSRAFEHEGRTWLLSSDLTVVPADRTRPFRTSSFRGVELGANRSLPLAWIRGKPRPRYSRRADGSFEAGGLEWNVRTAVELENQEPVEHGKLRYLQTKERKAGAEPYWIEERDASVVRTRADLPFSVGERDKWMIVSITQGTLVAYEGRRPVFTTLVSPGAGGVPIPGKDLVKMSTTPMGIFRVTFKHRAATMSPEKGENRSFWIADVPHTQYFSAPFALHTAYWHENFGEPMSAGCINLSPRDGARLFDWSEPRVPEGWNGSAAGRANGKGTFVVVVR